MKLTDIVAGVASDGRTKAERYEWNALMKRSKPMRIKIANLNVGEYQRGEASRASTIDKAKNFDHAAAGSAVVGQRKDGTFWIVDGLQRALAEAIRGDIDAVDCMVFQSDGAAHEAQVFQRCNLGRSTVKAVHKFGVAVVAGSQPEVEIAEWIKAQGMRIGKEKNRNEIGFPSYVVQFWKLNSAIAQRALLFTRRIGDGEMCANVFKGAYLLLSRGVEIEKYEDKITKAGGHRRILHDINATAIESGLSANMNVCAQGMLRCINNRKKNRIAI